MLNDNDLELIHYYNGPGRGGSYRLLHVPTGLFVEAKGSSRELIRRLGIDLKKKILTTCNVRDTNGNPFRPYPAPPSWPADVTRLAEALYDGADVAFALADALLEAGHPELAEHLRAEAWHPKGCWVVDAITGRA